MEILRLIAVHFGVALAMGLGFLIGPMAKRAFIAAADRVFQRRRSERWFMEVRTLEETMTERPQRRTYAPLRRGAARPSPSR